MLHQNKDCWKKIELNIQIIRLEKFITYMKIVKNEKEGGRFQSTIFHIFITSL